MQIKAAAALAATLVAVSVARMPAAVSDPVTTDAGKLSGVTLASGVRAFKGIPFGAPPIGQLRWKEPQPVPKWDGVRKADTFGNVCVQPTQPTRVPNNVTTDLPDSPAISEDCLYLNVWTSAPRAGVRRPVMVWIFGGAYAEGGGSSPHNDGEALAKKGVVMVSFNYRLGAFGFFSHPELTQESGHNASGNQALADSIAVLRWVKTNIAAFGGDPNNVTIFGESAGAAMVGGLAGSPVAKGLFQRAISESGAWMGLGMGPMLPRARAEQTAVIVPGARGRGRGDGPQAGPAPAPPPLPPLAELRARSADEVVTHPADDLRAREARHRGRAVAVRDARRQARQLVLVDVDVHRRRVVHRNVVLDRHRRAGVNDDAVAVKVGRHEHARGQAQRDRLRVPAPVASGVGQPDPAA